MSLATSQYLLLLLPGGDGRVAEMDDLETYTSNIFAPAFTYPNAASSSSSSQARCIAPSLSPGWYCGPKYNTAATTEMCCTAALCNKAPAPAAGFYTPAVPDAFAASLA